MDEYHLKALDLVSFVGSRPTVLANDGGPAYEPSNPIAVMLTFQALITKHQTFPLFNNETVMTRFRVLGYSKASGGHIVLQKTQGKGWSKPLYYKPILRLTDLDPRQMTDSDGVVCWETGGARPDRHSRFDMIVLADVSSRDVRVHRRN